jgi:hypothetical protein
MTRVLVVHNFTPWTLRSGWTLRALGSDEIGHTDEFSHTDAFGISPAMFKCRLLPGGGHRRGSAWLHRHPAERPAGNPDHDRSHRASDRSERWRRRGQGAVATGGGSFIPSTVRASVLATVPSRQRPTAPRGRRSDPGTLPYLVVSGLRAAARPDGTISLGALLAAFREAGHEVGPRRREDLEHILRQLYVFGYLDSADESGEAPCAPVGSMKLR